jgi:hypothetical protein
MTRRVEGRDRGERRGRGERREGRGFSRGKGGRGGDEEGRRNRRGDSKPGSLQNCTVYMLQNSGPKQL